MGNLIPQLLHCKVAKPQNYVGVVVKIRVPLWVLNIIRHLLFRVPKKGTLILTTTRMEALSSLGFGFRAIQ